MKTTLNTLKNLYAQERGYENWDKMHLKMWETTDMEYHMNEICIRAQKAALENAAENAKTKKTGNSGSYFDASVDRDSITNPENLIR